MSFSRLFDHVYILATLVFGLYSQLIMRWQVSRAGDLPSDTLGKVRFIFDLLMNPWVISGVVATFLSGVSWMLAMTKFPLNYAYPWTSISFLIIFIVGVFVFDEPMSLGGAAGTVFVVIGVIMIASGRET